MHYLHQQHLSIFSSDIWSAATGVVRKTSWKLQDLHYFKQHYLSTSRIFTILPRELTEFILQKKAQICFKEDGKLDNLHGFPSYYNMTNMLN